MVFLELNYLVTNSFDFIISFVEISLQRFLIDNPCLLFQLLVFFPQAFSQLLKSTELSLFIIKNVI